MLVPHKKAVELWEFALAFYDLPGVQTDCLTAQNEFNLDVTTLIFALHRARNGKGFDANGACALADSLSIQFTQPLRHLRTALKAPPSGVDPFGAEHLRNLVKQAELQSERLTLETLDKLPDDFPAQTEEAALFAVAKPATSPLRADLEALLKRLAISAQNM